MPAATHALPKPTLIARLFVLVGALAAFIVAGALAPEPDPVPRRWQLDLKLGPLRMVTLDISGERRSFYYLTYRVTNNSAEDLLLAPSFEMATDAGQMARSGRDVPAEATRQILEMLANPFLEDQISILGVILQGEENAKDGVVIWPVNDMHPGEIAIYASGFSGETKYLDTKDAKTGEPKREVLRKSFMARFQMPGELSPDRGAEPFPLAEQPKWIMR